MTEDTESSSEVLINDGIDFKNVYSLWGGSIPPSSVTLVDEGVAASSPSSEGLTQLWNSELDGFQEESIDQDRQEENADAFQAYASLQWWSEVSEDGNELRLSQILADEDFEEAMDEEGDIPMTFERFAEETEKLIEQAEDERKETEAIMNAPPNAEFLEAVKDTPIGISAVERSIAASDKFEEMILSLARSNEVDEVISTIIPETDLDILEMDIFPEDGSSRNTDTQETRIDDNPTLVSNE